MSFGADVLFRDASFVVNSKDRIALVGKNGAGKTTLLRIIAGLQQPSEGVVSISKDTTIGYLPQVMQTTDTRTLKEEAATAFDSIRQMSDRIDVLNAQLARRTDYDSAAYMQLVESVARLTEQFALQGTNYQAELERTLLGLGFKRNDFDRPTHEFSGGWRMRIELAKLLLRRPSLLLLDEPTNHLDIESIRWLEDFLAAKADAVILVSHDRAFINNVTRRTLEISCHRVIDYKVKYDDYVRLRAERREQQLRAYENQQKEIADIKDFIERFRYKATKAVQVQSRIKQLERMVPVEVDEVDNAALRLKFPPAPRSGDYPLICEGVKKAYGNRLVFENVTLTLRRGEKAAFVGKNGEGKTTLVRCIMGETPFEGSLKVGHNVLIGYFAQNQARLLDPQLTVFETIDRVAVGEVRTQIRNILGAFMFGGEAIEKKVSVLSGGERSRLAMIRLLLQPVNFLILDEPTNHLDMRSKDVLKEAIRAFDGTVVVVSHDRDFLDGLVSKVYEFADGRVKEHLGGIYDFLKKKNISDPSDLLLTSARKQANNSQPCPTNDKRLSYEQQKERQKLLRKLEKSVQQCEEQVSELEAAVSMTEQQLSTPEGAADAALCQRHAALKQQLDRAVDEWEKAATKWEEAKKS